MICIVGNRPVLQVGRQQVTGYGTQWLRDTIIRGAQAAEREDFPFVRRPVRRHFALPGKQMLLTCINR